MKQFGIMGIMLVLMAVSVAATAHIDYTFNVPNVQVEAYNCLDAGCNTVGTFSGSFPNGQSTTNGQLRVDYPTKLAVPDGYVIYYFSPGYIAQAYRATWASNGVAAFNINFNQATDCSSVIDTFTVTNDAHANVPLVVHTSASLDAITRSAFWLSDLNIGYIPPAYKEDYYSVDTRVTLTITDGSGATVNTQSVDFTAANGNAIFAGTSQPVDFSWTPSTDGSYTATVTTTVIDNQCASQIPQSSSSAFSVLPALPQNECYTILNGLAATPIVGIQNQPVTLDFNKISNNANNYAFNDDPNYQLTPVPTDISYSVSGPSGVVAAQTFTAGANADNSNPSAQGFTFTPTETGMHTVTVTGVADSALCAGLLNIPNTVTLNVNVIAPPTYKITFQLVDGSTGGALSGATVNVAGQTFTTDANGYAVASGLPPASYSYTITKDGYVTLSGTVNVVNTDMTVLLTMQRQTDNEHGTVTFIVRDGLTQAAISGASVVFNGVTQTTDANGQTSYPHTAAGTYDFSVSAAGYNAGSGSVTADGVHDQQVPVSLTPTNDGGSRTVTFHVYDVQTNANLAGAHVTLSGGALDPNGISMNTDANGNAVFPQTAQATYSYTVSLAGYNTVDDGVMVGANDVLVQVPMTNGAPATHSVTYTVVDATSGTPLQGVSVVFNGVTQTTDANGVVVYSALADGVYAYSAALVGYDTASGTTQVAGADVQQIIPLTRAGTVHQVTFHVTDGTTGIALPGVAVSFDGRAATTGPDGTVVFNNVPDATYNYAATLNGYAPASGAFTVQGGDATVNVQMFVLNGANKVTVHVFDATSGADLPGAFVRFDGQQGTTDIHGNLVLTNVPNGSFPWDVNLANYYPASGVQDVNGNVVLNVPLTPMNACITHTAYFMVYDGKTVKPIANAAITIGASQTVSFVTTTDQFGGASVTLCDGSYDYTVKANGYQDVSGLFTLAGSDTFIMVPMAATGPTPTPVPVEPEMGVYIGSIRIPDIQASDGYVPILITFKNDGDTELDGVKVTAVSTDLGLRAPVGPFDLGRNEQRTAQIMLPTDGADLQPGLYPIRLTVSNDDISRVVYRDLEVDP